MSIIIFIENRILIKETTNKYGLFIVHILNLFWNFQKYNFLKFINLQTFTCGL